MLNLSQTKLALLGASALALAGCMDTSSIGSDGQLRPFTTVTYDHWDVRDRFSTRHEVFQNVTQEDLVTLMSGKTFVGYEESGGRGGAYGALTVMHWGTDGARARCFVSYRTGKPVPNRAFGIKPFASIMSSNQRLGIAYPMVRTTEYAGDYSYSATLYHAASGAIASIGYNDNNRLEDIRKGHLQSDIPAAVYTACPEFPSAESLGTVVNPNQTSWNYFDLVQQDAGDRVIRPDLVTEYTAVPLGATVAVSQ